MNTIIITKLKRWSILTVFLGFFACNNNLTDMNQDPNQLTSIDDKYLFTSAVMGTLDPRSDIFDLRMGSQYAHVYVSPNLGRDADKYADYSQIVFNNTMSSYYTGPLKIIHEIFVMFENQAPNPAMDVKMAMLNVLAVCNYATLTDFYGSVPYTEGAWARKNILYPKYDTQEFIYHDMLDKLKSAIAVLKIADPNDAYPGFDPLYNNDLIKWVRFANSMRLRLAMRARFVDPVNSKNVITECLNENLIEDSTQDAKLAYTNSDFQELNNEWYNLYISKDKWKMSELFVNQLSSTNDPRLPVLVQANSLGQYKGIKNGLNDLDYVTAFGQPDYCSPSPNLYAKNLPAYLISADEVSFLKAEAALFNLGSGDPNQFYQEGIRKSMEKWDIPEMQISNFITVQAEATLNGSDDQKFRQICTQQWIAFVPNFRECYNNMRRTDYPIIVQRTTSMELGVTNGYLPKRLLYGTNEFNSNNVNVTEAVAMQGPNKITTPLWWDVK